VAPASKDIVHTDETSLRGLCGGSNDYLVCQML